jgi:hypothetical protein
MVNKFRRYLMNISEVWWNRACLDFEIQQNSVDLAEKLAQNLDLMEPNFSSRLNLCQLHLHKLSLVSTTPRFRMTDVEWLVSSVLVKVKPMRAVETGKESHVTP